MKYKVISLTNTQKNETEFDTSYHEKYIGMIAEEMPHNFKPGVFQDFVLLIFETDSTGRPTDMDWMHRDDLEMCS